MRKTALLLTTVMMAATLFTGCNINPENPKETSKTTFDSALDSEIQKQLDADGPHYESMAIDFNPKDYGRIIPNITAYTEDMWAKENDSALYAFIDLNGEMICGPLFDYVSYDKNSDSYIVRRTENGVSKYGFLSSNGAVFTGLFFDGAAAAQNTDDDELCFFGSIYEDGKLWVCPINIDLEILLPTAVTIDEGELSLTASDSQLSVLYMNDESAVMINRKEFYYSTFLVDIKSGNVLQKFGFGGSESCNIFGNVIVKQDIRGQGITVYGMNGSVLVEDPKAYSGRLSRDLYMVANDGELKIYDGDWNKVDSMTISSDDLVMTSFGRIAVVGDHDTKVYDKTLKLINTLDYALEGGTYFRDWYDFGEGNMFYDSISATNEIINLNNGNKLSKEDGFFYEFSNGYILADNESNGNDPVKKFRVYDREFKEIISGEGSAYIAADRLTNDLYLIILNDGAFTVYSMPSMDVKFRLKAFCYSLNPIGGKFYGNDKQHFVFVDGKGNEILCYELDYKKVNEI